MLVTKLFITFQQLSPHTSQTTVNSYSVFIAAAETTRPNTFEGEHFVPARIQWLATYVTDQSTFSVRQEHNFDIRIRRSREIFCRKMLRRDQVEIQLHPLKIISQIYLDSTEGGGGSCYWCWRRRRSIAAAMAVFFSGNVRHLQTKPNPRALNKIIFFQSKHNYVWFIELRLE